MNNSFDLNELKGWGLFLFQLNIHFYSRMRSDLKAMIAFYIWFDNTNSPHCSTVCQRSKLMLRRNKSTILVSLDYHTLWSCFPLLVLAIIQVSESIRHSLSSPILETFSQSGDTKPASNIFVSEFGDCLPKRRLSPKQEKCRTVYS